MSDIVERLRHAASGNDTSLWCEAADEIERLRAKLRQCASECAECGGAGCLEFDSCSYPGFLAGDDCPECADIRELLT